LASRERVQKLEAEAIEALKQIRAQSAMAGVSKEAGHFDGEAKKFEIYSRVWLTCSFILAVLLIGLAVGFYLNPHFPHGGNAPGDKWALAQRIGAKLLLLSVL